MTRKRKARKSQSVPSEEKIATFRARMAEQEDLAYGLALLFEVLSVVYSMDEALLDTYRREHVNLIQQQRDDLFRASALLESVESGCADVADLRVFRFEPFKGLSDPESLVLRCKSMVYACGKLFPDRPRERPFSSEEALKMGEEAVWLLRATVSANEGDQTLRSKTKSL